MKGSVLLFCAILVVVGARASSEDPTETLPGILDLTPDTFDQYVNGAKHALVEFYAPWCGHCKRMTPELKKLGEALEADGKLKSRVVVAKVDADKHRSLGEKFEVKGFPTIKYFGRGQKPTKDTAEDYNSARTAEKMVAYLHQKVQEDKAFARVESLDTIASQFVEASDKAQLVKDAKAKVAELSGDEKANGEIYIKLMEKAVEKGADYLAKEKARVDKILSSGSVAAAKVEEMSKKSSILSAFADE